MHDWLRRLPPNVQGALWLVAGGFIFTSTSAMIRLLSTQVESVQTAFFRAVISVILLLPMMLTGRVKPWHSKRIAGHFWRTLMGSTSMVLGFYAVSLLPLADATALGFSQPLFSVCVAAVVLREKVRWRRWTATIVGFIGVLWMLFLTGTALNVQSLMGTIFLVGVAVNNGVLLVDFANARRLEGADGAVKVQSLASVVSTVSRTVPAKSCVVCVVAPAPSSPNSR